MFDVINDDRMHFCIQYVDNSAFAHFKVYAPWTPSFKKECQAIMRDYLHLLDEPLFAAISITDKKCQKFTRLLGATKVHESPTAVLYMWSV